MYCCVDAVTGVAVVAVLAGVATVAAAAEHGVQITCLAHPTPRPHDWEAVETLNGEMAWLGSFNGRIRSSFNQ